MKYQILSVIFSVLSTITYGQTNKKEKVKIVLLGSMHFTPSTQDAYSNKELELTPKKQKELQEVVSKLANFKPDQICIEVPVDKQESINRLYQRYLAGQYKLELNEIDLLGFQTAKVLNLPKLTCVNYKGKFDTQEAQEAAKRYGQETVLKDMNLHAQDLVDQMNEKEAQLSMKDHLVYLNSQNTLNRNLQYYIKYFVNIGKGDNYEGTDLVSEWYTTNLRIYTNILRMVGPADNAILVIYGQGHIPILKHLFESNNDFEIVEVEDLLLK
ncbi:DUF5694 domain-containing protein [Flavobacterium sp. MFBS3-15]|uniref:DUF5694 domain-containing protein n=1 Tax=Flavobacterium sp. MFBS3-15 TaxID=2989816 RepID=UPI002236B29C|nr:DUF5694 domain-containing protein [Flavobacterium sp. MFBS3-15]MCW4470204.1 DUF5694 domain-containing protein [Flavobacterium sp. MFBS3-15]